MAEQAYHPYHLVDPSPWPLIGACGSYTPGKFRNVNTPKHLYQL